MAFQEATGYCNRCNKQVLLRRRGISNLLHLLLTLLTGGLWLLIWIFLVSKIAGGWRCTICGRETARRFLRYRQKAGFLQDNDETAIIVKAGNKKSCKSLIIRKLGE
jgi:hypothetical protein